MKHYTTLLTYFITLWLIFPTHSQEIEPPKAKKDGKTFRMHGDTWDDPYYWIHQKSDREVLNYISAENGYTQRIMRDTELFQKKLVEELKGRHAETYQSLPIKRGEYYYYNRLPKDANYGIYCRKKGSMKAREEVLLDMNKLAKGSKFAELLLFRVSPDHGHLAYAVDYTGREQPTMHFKNLKTGETYDDQILKLASAEWLNNNKDVYYTVFDSLQHSQKVYRHTLGDKVENDKLIYETDELYVFVKKTQSEEFIMLSIDTQNESYALLTSAERPTDKVRLFTAKKKDRKYTINHFKGDDYFHVMSNYREDKYQLFKAPLKKTKEADWEILHQVKADEELEGYKVFKDYLVVTLRKNGLKSFRVINRANQETYKINFPEQPYTVGAGNTTFESNTLRFAYTSYVQPSQIFDFDLETKNRKLIRQEKVYGAEGYQYRPEGYETKRVFAPTRDGIKVPISIVYKKGMKLDGSNPMFLTGYGSYGITNEPYFNPDLLTLLDRGIIVGQAHIRGSGYLGQQWYKDGKMMKKKNSIYDFIDASKYLIDEGYTSSDRLIAQGGSAGGMLMGAVANTSPELYKGIIAQVPAMDLLNFLSDEKFSGSKFHHQEWGDPKGNKTHYDYVKSYSPYDNVEAKAYPHILITGGFQDIRVRYMEPTKYVAKMRDLKTDNKLLLMKMNMNSGHGLSSGRFSGYKQSAFVMAFVFKILGIESDYSSLSGVVYDKNGDPLPFATVVLDGTTNGTTTNTKGEYHFELKKGKYKFNFQFVGFESQSHEVDLNKPQTLNITLKAENTLLKEVTISGKFNDPAYGIIKHAQEKRKDYLKSVQTYRVKAYMKSINRFDEMPKKLPPFIPKSDMPDSTDLGLIYLSESQSIISRKGKNDSKEEMISSKVAGKSQGYSWNRAMDEGLNFYENRVMLEGLNERGFISPIAANALLFYRYEYLGELQQDGRKVNKIRVIPRRKNDPTFRGFIYIGENSWHISAVDFGLENQHIEFFDTLSLKQEYVGVKGVDEQEHFMLMSSRIYAHLRIFGFGIGVNSVRSFSDYDLDPLFTKSFFNNEVFYIHESANKKDSNFWKMNRPVLLTPEEEKYYYKGDSVEVRKQSKAYLDSLDRTTNKVNFGDLIDGFYYYKRYRNLEISTNGIPEMIGFNTVEGLTGNLRFRVRKGDDDRTKYIWTNRLRYGFSNKRWNATTSLTLPLNRHKQQSISFGGGRFIEQFNNYQPITMAINTAYSLFRRENFMKLYGKDYLQVRYRQELVNGVYFNGSLKWENREPLQNTTDFAFANERADRAYTSNNPQDPASTDQFFERHQAMVFDAQLRFVIKQKYARTPYRKVPEGTKYPIFTLNYRKGIKTLGSDVNYDFLSLNMGHDLDLGLLGESKFDVAVGGFLNDKQVEFVDHKHFFGNQTLFLNYYPGFGRMRPPLNQFQLLDYYSASTTGNYLEAHYEHHFNGFLVNKLPLLRKTKFQVVGGVNYLKQKGLDHVELSVGLENILKVFRVDFVTGYSNTEQLKGAVRLRLGL